jgi:hypothetical protein
MIDNKLPPPPWRIESHSGGCDVYAADGECIASCLDKATARLIAAAPELFSVLERLEESAAYWSEYDVPLGIFDDIKNTLKKARDKT